MICITPMEVISFEGRGFWYSLSIQNNSSSLSTKITGWRQEGVVPPFDLSELPVRCLDPWELCNAQVRIKSPKELGDWSCQLFAETVFGDILVPVRGFNKRRPMLVSPDFDIMEVVL